MSTFATFLLQECYKNPVYRGTEGARVEMCYLCIVSVNIPRTNTASTKLQYLLQKIDACDACCSTEFGNFAPPVLVKNQKKYCTTLLRVRKGKFAEIL